MRKPRIGHDQANDLNGGVWVCCSSWMPFILAWSPHYHCCMCIHSTSHLHQESSLITHFTFVDTWGNYILVWQDFILEMSVQITFFIPWNCFPWLNCRQPCKTVPEPLTVTQNMLSASSVGWVSFFKAEQGTYTLCPWAAWGSCVNQVSLSSSSDVLLHRTGGAITQHGSYFGFSCRCKQGLHKTQKEESTRKVW